MKALIVMVVCVLLSTAASTEPPFRTVTQECSQAQEAGLVHNGFTHHADLEQSRIEREDWSYAIGAPVLSSLRIADIVGDSEKEIISTTYGLPPNPYGSGMVYVIHADGTVAPGWPVITSSPFPASAAIGDVDADGDNEIVVGDWSQIAVYNGDGSLFPGWPISNGLDYSPALEDLDVDGDLEIIYPSDNNLYIRHHTGVLFHGWPVSAPEAIGSPAVADVDADGAMEIIAGTLTGPVGPDPFEVYVWKLNGSVLPGFPVPTSGTVKSTPAVGDIDNDGSLEIVAAAYHTSNLDYLYCWENDGTLQEGWPVRADYCRLSSPALADIDGNGNLEVFIGGLRTSPEWMEMLFGFHHDGAPLANYPVDLPHPGGVANINSSPVIAEVDGDLSQPEIFVKVVDHVFALHADGTIMHGFPYYLPDNGASGTHSPSPAIDDLDDDGDSDYVFSSSNGSIAFLDVETTFADELSSWPMYKHDRHGLSRFGASLITSWELYANLDGNTVALSWSAAQGASSLSVYRGTYAWFEPDMTAFANRVAILPGNSTGYTDSYGVGDPATTGFYRIVAWDTAVGELGRTTPAGEIDFLVDIPFR
jgi:hypothetical protein